MNPHLPIGNFYGEMVRQYQAGGFSLSETRYLPQTKLPRHSHESHYFCFVLCGSYRESFEQRARDCEPAMTLYHPAGELHAQEIDKTAVNLFRIEVRPARLQYPTHRTLSIAGRDFKVGPHIGVIDRLYRELCDPDPVSHLAIEGLALELIALLARASDGRKKNHPQPPRWLRQAHELVASRYLEQLTLADIAGTVGIHPMTLAREFHRVYGCTVGQMVRRKRIKFACRELLKRDMTVAETAVAAGFYDQSHFARTFKKIMGLTPARYRTHFLR
jgi:AraC family transcriptional regulator